MSASRQQRPFGEVSFLTLTEHLFFRNLVLSLLRSAGTTPPPGSGGSASWVPSSCFPTLGLRRSFDGSHSDEAFTRRVRLEGCLTCHSKARSGPGCCCTRRARRVRSFAENPRPACQAVPFPLGHDCHHRARYAVRCGRCAWRRKIPPRSPQASDGSLFCRNRRAPG